MPTVSRSAETAEAPGERVREHLRASRISYASLTLLLLPLASCADGSPTFPANPADVPSAGAEYPTPGGVSDLAPSGRTPSSVTLTWTEGDDGAGSPAQYRLKYAEPAIDWRSATVGCDVEGVRIGQEISCTVEGLQADTDYEFLLMSYRLNRSSWAGAKYSNVTTGRTEPEAVALSVPDLGVAGTTTGSVALEWTQVDDGTGAPANYRVKYGSPSIGDWGSAAIGCERTVVGTDVGAPISCVVEGLAASTAYEFQLMAFRTASDGSWAAAEHSNLVRTLTAEESGPPPWGDAPSSGIWIGREELLQLPTSGAAWDRLLADAGGSPGKADISNQDSNHDVYTLAAALVCVRIGENCDKARRGVLDAIGTEEGGRWLAVGRNLASYVIAADLLGLRADGSLTSAGTRVQEWIESWLTLRLSDNNDWSLLRQFGPFHSSANAAAQEGFAYAAVAAYLGDSRALERAWDAFRTFACDPTGPDRESIYLDPPVRDGWTHDEQAPCAVNPAGTTKRVPSGLPGAGSVRRVDGALVGDMRRGGAFQWEPGYTQYVWVGLEGFVPAAVILERAGYPAFEVADRAVLRTHEYLWHLRSQTGDARWFDGDRAREIVHLVNARYGTSFPVNRATGRGRTVGYTDWTHP